MQPKKMKSLKRRNKAAYNTGFASGGLTPLWRGKLCKLGALCFYSSAALVDSFPAKAGQVVIRNPPERQAQKRYVPF